MAWIGSAAPVGDDVYLYYAGYRWGHKHNRTTERQIGLLKIPRDRYVARYAGPKGGTITTPVLTFAGDGEAMTINAEAAQTGQVRVQVTDASGKPLPGFSFEECQPITGDSLAAPVKWKQPLSALRGQPVRLEFSLKDTSVYGLELQGGRSAPANKAQ
jgi:hypothetical protein